MTPTDVSVVAHWASRIGGRAELFGKNWLRDIRRAAESEGAILRAVRMSPGRGGRGARLGRAFRWPVFLLFTAGANEPGDCLFALVQEAGAESQLLAFGE